MPPIQKPQIYQPSPDGGFGNVLGQMISNKQQQGGDFASALFAKRFEPTMGDVGQSAIQTTQSFAKGSPFQAITPEQQAQQRMGQELAPYTTAMGLQKQQLGIQGQQAELDQVPLKNQLLQAQIANQQRLASGVSSAGSAGGFSGKTQFERLSNALMGYDQRLANGEQLSMPEKMQYNLIKQNLDKVGTSIDKTRLTTANNQATSNQNIAQILDTAEGLINQGTLGNSLGDRAEMFGAKEFGFGSSNPEVVRTKALMDIGNQLVLARGSLGTGVSTADAARYDSAAGDFSTAQSNAQRMQSISVMREIAGKYINQANDFNQSYQDTGELPDYNLPSAAPIPSANPMEPKQAPDGHFYIPDPQRPGKFLRVD